jgi:predicted  nucleic acid-binding Zn-ribbon protein
MVRRIILTAGGLGLVAVMFFGRDAFSYVKTSAGWVKESVKSSIPVEFEIERARKMVKDLVPDIRRNMHVIAQEEVELERLEKQIAETEASVARDREGIMRLKTDLTSASTAHTYNGRTYSVKQVKADLSNRFERFKTTDATLGSLKDIHAARKQSLEAARQKLEGMLAAKGRLEAEVQNLEARLKMVEVAQTTSNYQFDDSQLGRAKELIAEVRTRLNVAERLVNAETKFDGEIPLDANESEDIVEQVTEYFAPQAEKVAEVAVKITE